MAEQLTTRWLTLSRREFAEHRGGFIKTPLIAAIIFVVVTLIGVIVANRIVSLGGGLTSILADNDGFHVRVLVDADDDGTTRVDYRVIQVDDPVDDSEWDFSRNWNFNPTADDDPENHSAIPVDMPGSLYEPLLDGVGTLMNLVLIIVIFVYLLGSLFDDRRDRSVLFWKSMPVSEWEVVLSKFVTALLIVPLVFFLATLGMQLLSLTLLMIRAWFNDLNPLVDVLGQVDFLGLIIEQLAAILNTALWVAPLYAWLLLASAAARRSPFLVALVPVLALLILEGAVLGTGYVGELVGGRLSMLWYEESILVGPLGSGWGLASLVPVLSGLVTAAAMLALAVWLRHHRWEI